MDFFRKKKIPPIRALKFITGHVIYNTAYTYKFQLKTTWFISNGWFKSSAWTWGATEHVGNISKNGITNRIRIISLSCSSEDVIIFNIFVSRTSILMMFLCVTFINFFNPHINLYCNQTRLKLVLGRLLSSTTIHRVWIVENFSNVSKKLS